MTEGGGDPPRSADGRPLPRLADEPYAEPFWAGTREGELRLQLWRPETCRTVFVATRSLIDTPAAPSVMKAHSPTSRGGAPSPAMTPSATAIEQRWTQYQGFSYPCSGTMYASAAYTSAA